ncbi:MAG: outer membrane beta-barrel protein, partial [Pseudomonadota bacterium]
MRKATLLFSLTLSGAGAMAGAAIADSFFTRDRNISVLERPRPDYEAPGVRAGQFIVRPRLDLGVGATSNAFAVSNLPASEGLDAFEEEGDIYIVARPSVGVESTWSRHALAAGTYVEAFQNDRFDNEAVTNGGVFLNGQLDATRTSAIFGGLSYDVLHESRRVNNGAVLPETPIQYNLGQAHLGYRHELGRFRYTARLDADVFDYDDVDIILLDPQGTGDLDGELDQDFRDRTAYSVLGEVGFAVTRDASIFIQGIHNTQNYDEPGIAALGIPERDSEGWTIAMGTEFDLSRLSRGRVAVGYFEQDYKDPLFATASGVSVDAQVEWFPTELTTLTLTGSRGADESAIFDTGGFVSTRLQARVDHELRRNVILSAYGEVGTEEYPEALQIINPEGGATDQDVDRYGFGAGGTYYLNRYVSTNLSYAYFN